MSAISANNSIKLSVLLSGRVTLSEQDDCAISALTLDSRSVVEGTLFLACAGTVRHGMEFFEQAMKNGAAAIVCEPDEQWSGSRIAALAGSISVPLLVMEGLSGQVSAIAGRFYHHPSRSMSVTGITGTNGKTSCAQFLARALSVEATCGVIGTLGNGFPGALDSATHTTPDPVALQALLSDFRVKGASAVAMEVSSHALDQGRAADIRFDAAVFTNLSRDHLDYHGTLEEYGAAKRELFLMPDLGCAVINLDDAFGRKLFSEMPVEPVLIGYGLDAGNAQKQGLDHWVWAKKMISSANGMCIAIDSSWGSGELVTPLLGRFNASNLLAALAVLLYRNIPLNEALLRLSRLQTVPGRMERFGGEGQPLVVVDYAHTPDALEHALAALREHAEGCLICLVGCGGDRDRGKRPQMGAIAERIADQVIVTDDNPRTEDGDGIVQEILGGMARPEKVRVIRDRSEAIHTAVAEAAKEDLILVAGKGHETVQIVGELKMPFSDCEQVADALSGVSR